MIYFHECKMCSVSNDQMKGFDRDRWETLQCNSNPLRFDEVNLSKIPPKEGFKL